MKAPKYTIVKTLDDALAALADQGEETRILAGGTDLLVGERRETLKQANVIDITRVAELKGIQQENNYITIGALTTHTEINQNKHMASWAPVLLAACREIGSRQIRNRATIGGNLANASPAGDSIPALYVLDAEVRLQSLQGERWVPIAEFFTGPGTTTRQPEELLTAVRFAPFSTGRFGFFNKIGQRRAVTISKVSASGALAFDGKNITQSRIALGAVSPTVIRLPRMEEYLTGKTLDDAVIAEASAMAGELCSPIDDIRSTVAYRCHVSKILVKRGLEAIQKEVGLG